MEIKIEKNSITEKISFSGTVRELLQQLKINPETVLVIKDNEVITEDEELNDNDNVEILSVVSGG